MRRRALVGVHLPGPPAARALPPRPGPDLLCAAPERPASLRLLSLLGETHVNGPGALASHGRSFHACSRRRAWSGGPRAGQTVWDMGEGPGLSQMTHVVAHLSCTQGSRRKAQASPPRLTAILDTRYYIAGSATQVMLRL